MKASFVPNRIWTVAFLAWAMSVVGLKFLLETSELPYLQARLFEDGLEPEKCLVLIVIAPPLALGPVRLALRWAIFAYCR